MNRQSWKFRLIASFVAMAAFSTLAAVPTFAQVPVDAEGNPVGSTAEAPASGYNDTEQPVALSAGELDELVGPIALYPDDLLAIVLPASTYPLEIVQAARFLEQYEQDSTLQPNEDWDESVTALLNYPEVLRMLNDDIDWTWKLGDAVVNQQADVIAAVESFRDRAYAAGNLKSDQHQTVSEDDGIIEIVPVNEEIIYVPYYEPEQVVVRQATPVYYYYPRPYPVYYYPYPVGYSFYSGYFWGVTTAFQIGWATDHLRVCHQSYWGHPYFGHSYYGHYYRSPSVFVYNSWYVNNSPYYSSNRYRDGDYWRPRTHSRARPAYYSSSTRSYRDSDVNRGSSTRGYGNAYSAQGSSQGSAHGSTLSSSNRNDRLASSSERVRTDQGSTRDVRSDSIRFRERTENRQTVRRDSAAGATRADTTTRTDSRANSRTTSRTIGRTETRTESRRPPVTTTTTTSTINNRNRESARETAVRRPATERSDSAVARQSNSSGDSRTESRANSRATRQTGSASQPIQRTNQRSSNHESARVEVRNSAPERREVRTESRPESRPESRQESRSEARTDSRQAQASVRHGSQARRERN